MAETKLIGSAEACKRLDVDKSTLSRMVQRGEIAPAMRIGESANAAMLFRPVDVNNVILIRAAARTAAAH
jgi:excisionase family DNA binding protein